MKILVTHTLSAFLALYVVAAAPASAQDATQPVQFRVSLDAALGDSPVSGRLLVYLTVSEKPLDVITPGFGEETKKVWIVAREVPRLVPGAEVVLDVSDVTYPQPLTRAPVADYQVMALLDVDHNAAYTPTSPGDIRSPISALLGLNPLQSSPIELRLSERVAPPPIELPVGVEQLEFESHALHAFWGRPITMRGLVVLPSEYATTKQRYPTVYLTHGFSGTLTHLAGLAQAVLKEMAEGALPPMIYVLLDQSCAGGTHEFVNSLNNGPWGHALTRELIPHLERTYRMDAKPSGRFLTGHSSGGWAALWLQVTYPSIFGGVWATSPDPVDFRHFTNIDLTADTNVYVRPDGTPTPLVRMQGRDVASFEDFARQEHVLGDYGGQLSSFEWVFSPRGPDGRPMRLFDRETGVVDREVANYWLERYDISGHLARNAPALVSALRRKIHVIVGTADTFYLDNSVRLLEQNIAPLGYEAKITFIPNRTHSDLFDGGLGPRMTAQMYAVARPRHKWTTTATLDPATELVK